MSVQAMSWVIDNSEHKLGSLLVLLMIANHAKSDGTDAWPSVRTIARESRLSETQTHRCIRKLQRSRELAVEVGGGPHGTNLYHLPKFRQLVLNGTPSRMEPPIIRDDKRAPEPSFNHPTAKTPLPPADAGGQKQIVGWGGKMIEVEMGRRRRLPSLEAMAGCRPEEIVQFFTRRGFPARMVAI